MTQRREFSYPSTDGVHQIAACEWLPQGKPKAVVQIVHGVAEHMGRYDQAARFLNERGILVCGEDHLGHGKTVSDEKYGYFAKRDGWSLVTRDVRRLRQLQGEKYPGTPYFLLGHSMGSFLVRTFLCRYPGQVDGAILSGTGQESASLVALGKALAVLVGLVKGEDRPSEWIEQLSLGAYNKKFKPNRTTADWISRDEGAVDEYLADPLCSFRPTPGMFRDMMGGLQEIASPRALARMDPDTPILFLSGDHDPVGGMGKGVRKVYGYFEAHGVRDLTLKLYPGGRHEMFHEVNRQEVLEDLAAWVEKHC
jgi:alpha-beta hydrolase superfamily lysophospholipase